MEYGTEELTSIYELGRLYFEMGYFAPAERIFNGLAAVDHGKTWSRLGLGLVKLELGLFEEAIGQLRLALHGSCELQAKLALIAAFIGSGELPRAESLLGEVAKIIDRETEINPEIRRLFEAFALRLKS